MTITVTEHDLSLMDQVNSLARKARLAAAVFHQYSQEQVDNIVKAMTVAAINAAKDLAVHACEETKMGLVEDKIQKNLVASEFQFHQIRHKKTVGIIKEFPEDNMVEVAEPMGVILALSPVTNPTSTIIFKSIACAKTRNSIIFSPHLMAADSSNQAAKILYEAALAAGAPRDFITWVDKSPRLRRITELLMIHPEVDLIFATGGTQMVKAAYSSGKPAIGVGAGNTPVYVHKSANIPAAASDIIISKTFDNGTECPSEQTLIMDADIADQLLSEFKRLGCHVCTAEEVDLVTNTVIDPRTGGMNYKFVGQPAKLIADNAGFNVSPDCKIIICPLAGELRKHKLVVEKLMPVLGCVTVSSDEEGIRRAMDINYAGGTGHTAGIFADDESIIERYSEVINAGRIIVNSPTSIGGLGGVYNNLNTTLVFGCGTGGGNITTDNVGMANLLNYKRVPRRSNFIMSFQTTKNMYINPGSLDHLRELKTKQVFIVTSKSAAKRGHLEMVMERLPTQTRVDTFSEITAEPDFDTILRAISRMRQSPPDTIIALGGGSVLDAAKVIRLFYEYPELNFEEIAVNFLDFRHRLAVFPQKTNIQLVAIPTTSGTGSEVTPFAVLSINDDPTQPEKRRKLTLIDECLLPDVAIIDAHLTKTLPKAITVDSAIDALTHALESLVSCMASDYTDGLALEAMRLIFEALPSVLENPSNVLLRHKLHNAACLAGMAIGNASVGINHALAHSLGVTFDIPHGRANGVFLLTSLAHNAKIPKKLTVNSSYPLWIADEKYARAAQFLNLSSESEGKADKNNNSREARKQASIQALRRAVYDLLETCGQPKSVSELGISEEAFQKALPTLAVLAFEDLSLRTNPSLPLQKEIAQLLIDAYAPAKRP